MKIVNKELLKPSIFGMFDGLTSLLGVLIPLLSYEHLLVFRTCLGLAVSSAISMGLGEYLSSDKTIPKKSRVNNSLYMGVFTGIGCLAPVIPFAFIGGSTALAISLVLYILLTCVVASMKSSDVGWKASLIQTFAISLVAVLSVVALTVVLPVPAG